MKQVVCAFAAPGLCGAGVREGHRAVRSRRQPRRRGQLASLRACVGENADAEQQQRFYDTVVMSEKALNLFEALLCVADGELEKRVDVQACIEEMDAWSVELKRRVGTIDRDPVRKLRVINEFFFLSLRFRPVVPEEFHDPRNSLLNEVMRRRVGIPISLCVIYRELCLRGADLRLDGISFPAHFLLRLRGSRTVYINPSDSRKPVLRRSDLADMLRTYFPEGDVTLTSEMLEPADDRSIIVRVLRNLKTAYLNRNENKEALSVMNRLVLISPTTALERRDRGLLLHVMGRGQECVRDLEFYIALEKNSADAVVLRALIRRYRNSAAE
mmetsp:Transcript_4591/g.13887  ORF Transcript_4591/g.13887 Transcript_4591/m.13887 type:complete len:328 (-) Transcript_4591:131-1114(-)